MSESTETLIFEILKRIQPDLSDVKVDVREVKTRTTIREGHMAAMTASFGVMAEKMDRFDVRIERIERRLDLVDAR